MIKKGILLGIIYTFLVCSVSCSRTSQNGQSPDTVGENAGDTDSALEISVFYPEDTGSAVVDYSENETIRRLEETYNIKFEFYHGKWGEEKSAVEAMFSSGDYCDLVYLTEELSYKGGDEGALKDGAFWDLTELVREYMPNYYTLIQSDESLRRAAYNDDGQIVGLLVIPYNVARKTISSGTSIGGMIVRQDWLEASGLDLPATYDDWEEMLTVFRDKYDCPQPLYISSLGYTEKSPGFSAGLGALPSMQMNGDQVEYGPATEGWKAYVTLMHDWYEKGLIGAEYIVNDVNGIDVQACVEEETGAMLCVYHMVEAVEEKIGDGADFAAVQYPVLTEGQISQARDRSDVLGSRKIYVTTAVSQEELPVILNIVDQFYDMDNAMELTYGVEGDTYVCGDGGQIEFTEKMTNNPLGYTFLQAAEAYLFPSNLMALKDLERELSVVSAEDHQMCETWSKDGESLYVPMVTLTSAEKDCYDRIMMDAEPYVRDMTSRMIVGAADIETQWEEYVRTLKAMGIDDAVKCYQDAYNRYIHR